MIFDKLLSNADDLKDYGDIEEALSLYKEALTMNPDSSLCYFRIASCYYIMKNNNESIAYYKKGLEIEPDNNRAIFLLALTYFYSDQENDALLCFKNILSNNPTDAEANYFVGIIEKDENMAIPHLEQALEGDLGANECEDAKRQLQSKYLMLGILQIGESKIEQSKTNFQKALAIGDVYENPEIYEIAADSLKSIGIIDLANKFYVMAGLEINIPETFFTKEYLESLVKFSNQLSDIIKIITHDETITITLKKSLAANQNVDDILTQSILFDLAQILKILSNDHIDFNNLKTASFILLISNLLPDLSSQFIDFEYEINLDYETLARSHALGKVRKLAESLFKIVGIKNPIKIKVPNNDNDESYTRKIQNELSIPALLKIMEHPLFDDYATTLNQFASIIANADNAITKEDEFALEKINQLIHQPF